MELVTERGGGWSFEAVYKPPIDAYYIPYLLSTRPLQFITLYYYDGSIRRESSQICSKSIYVDHSVVKMDIFSTLHKATWLYISSTREGVE